MKTFLMMAALVFAVGCGGEDEEHVRTRKPREGDPVPAFVPAEPTVAAASATRSAEACQVVATSCTAHGLRKSVRCCTPTSDGTSCSTKWYDAGEWCGFVP